MERTISVPDLAVWTATRVVLGVGVGMLVSRHMSDDARKATGLALVSVGGLLTIPLAVSMLCKRKGNWELRSAA